MWNKLALYCRSGFEKETAAEITEKATNLGVFGFARVEENSGYVIFECYQAQQADYLAYQLACNQLIFARQILVVSDLIGELPIQDRISPLLEKLQQAKPYLPPLPYNQVWVETPDTNEAKSLLTFCRKFTVPLRQHLQQNHLLNENNKSKQAITLHLFFIRSGYCYLGYSYNQRHTPHFMGIPRLKFPPNAPSRSTLKLEEAINLFLSPIEQKQRMNEEKYAVDLGACPGGWTYQLVKRGMFVYAVDHGKMATSLHETGRIEHCMEDGFKFQPPKRRKIDWLVCDMVEQPSRITRLMLKWLINGWCNEMIFNLKLPMKKRYNEVKQCLELIENTLQKQQINYKLQAKHLYHDREEISVHIHLI
ncbi:23S rRNA (cytidine(2498)-2'-O)-methyltransferase RlmM [Mergibacter septicus]|uniref:23S rRNA (cytidine(2498)-2'-O)-methyltransferase RlmM n=1 Tax=Mergibacter septicus TaxID=221402 RepID=UPI0011790C20|nr:23S rRNA (cytidine(2498)-2'-O)-methyltransferase RlmM [Mergibacter septicus]AWX13705.1 23S rRNA (cytidine(2498)-2'-O)-methyltransferase RlmM [Mergibacter septicus]